MTVAPADSADAFMRDDQSKTSGLKRDGSNEP
jgi:hypothetical protein